MECDAEACKTPEKGLADGTKLIGWKYSTINWKLTDPATLVAAMQQALQLKPTAIVIPSTPQAVWQSEVKPYEAAGVKIIPIFGSSDLKDGGAVIGNLASDAPLLAAQSVSDYVIVKSAGSAKSLVVSSPDVPSETSFVDALQKDFAANCTGCKSSPLNLSLAQFGSGGGTSAVVSQLQKDPSIKYVINAYGPQLPGLTSALAAAGLSGKVTVAGYSAGTAEFQGVKDKQFGAYVGVAYRYVGILVVDLLLRDQEGMSYDPTDGGVVSQIFTSDSTFTVDDAVNFAAPADMDTQFAKLWLVSS